MDDWEELWLDRYYHPHLSDRSRAEASERAGIDGSAVQHSTADATQPRKRRGSPVLAVFHLRGDGRPAICYGRQSVAMTTLFFLRIGESGYFIF